MAESSGYAVSLRIGDKVRTAYSTEPINALLSLPVNKFTVKATIEVSKDGKKWKQSFRPLFFKKLYQSKTFKELWNGRAIKYLK